MKNVFLICGIVIILCGVLIFYPKKFKKKTILPEIAKTRSVKGIKLFNYFFCICCLILVVCSMILIEARISIEVLKLKITGEIFLVMTIASSMLLYIISEKTIIDRIHNLVGCRVPALPDDIGKSTNNGETVLIFFSSDKFEKKAEIKRIKKSLEKIKSKKIKVFEVNPLESDGKYIFNRFKLSDEIVSLAIQPRTADSIVTYPNYKTNPISVVIISEMYIKEYWIGYEECEAGLKKISSQKIGTISTSTIFCDIFWSSNYTFYSNVNFTS